MKIFLCLCAIAGWYFILNMFHGLKDTAFTAVGASFSWFAILFGLGTIAICWVLLKD